MPDLLTHVLLAYAAAGLLAWRTRFPERYVPVVCVGATMPDAMKAAVVADVASGSAFGVPYSFWGLHTLGGVAVLGGIGALTIRSADRRAALGALVAGGIGHLVLDLFVIRVDGLGPPYLFPLTGWLPPAGNLYASSDLWPVAVALAVAVPVWIAREVW
ncbi:metal-dependent hydrolase [Halobellus rubicundus]|uniref:Metal-dependent hydrolase n=1 Tax=Halobellus rubicundus TaxID=2996466 RepID=A0ABD5MEZ9_9EURY